MTVQERIAKVIAEHQYRVGVSYHQPMCCACQEGCANKNGHMLHMEVIEHPAHVAEAIVEALQLIEETQTYEDTEVVAHKFEGNMRWGGQTVRSLGWCTETRVRSPWVRKAPQ